MQPTGHPGNIFLRSRGRRSPVFTAAGLIVLLALLGCGRPIRTAAWAVRSEIASPEGVEQVCKEAREAGLDTLVVQVRGRGDAYYASALAPRAERLAESPEGFDPLAQVLQACHGIRVLAWMNVFYLWGGLESPEDPLHPARARPEWLLRDADGRPVSEYSAVDRALGWIEGVYADPSAGGYRDHFEQIVREVTTKYAVAGVHLDFIRYPGPGFGQAGPLGDLFRDAWGLDPAWIPGELRSPDLERWLSGTAPPGDRVLATAALLWGDLRASQVTALVRGARRGLDSARPGLELSAAVFPDAGGAYLDKGQDWRTWASLGIVDALYPMAYYGGPERVGSQLASVSSLLRGAAPGVQLWAGLGAFIKTVDQVAVEARAARGMGYDGVCLFDVGNALGKPGGLRGYVKAVEGKRSALPSAEPNLARTHPRTAGGQRLAAILDRASGARPPQVPRCGEVLDQRWAEFEEARGGAIPRTLARLRGGRQRVPGWVDMDGIFRYLHPQDGTERRRTQFEKCEHARERTLAGEDFAAVAQELSQGGTRSLGGVLARHYLGSGHPAEDAVAGLASGDVSRVAEVSNGCWVYRVRAREEAASLPLDEIPWPARRTLFRSALNEELAEDDENRKPGVAPHSEKVSEGAETSAEDT